MTNNLNIKLSAFPLSTQISSSAAFDSSSTIGGGWGIAACGSPLTQGPSIACNPPFFPIRQSTTPFIGGSQTFSTSTSQLISQADTGFAHQNFCSGIYSIGACGGAYSVLGGIPGAVPGSYGLSGSLNGYPFSLLGSDQNFVNQFGEPAPVSGVVSCPFTQVTNACNPYTIILTNASGNQTAYNVYRFDFVIFLKTYGSAPIAATGCNPNFISSASCTTAEVQALNAALNSINLYNKMSGTILVDLSLPDPFRTTSPLDTFGIVGSWIAGGLSPSTNNACVLSSTANGGTIQVTPCGPHLLVPNTKLQFTPSNNEPSITSYSSYSTIPPLNPNGQLVITVNNMGMNYKANCNPTDCSNSGGQDCLTNNSCVIQYDTGELSVSMPIILDVIATGPNLQLQAKSIGLITGPSPGPLPQLGNIKVHVQDAVSTFPLSGMQVGLGSSGSCTTVSNPFSTDGSGNVILANLNPAQYTVCAAGGSGVVNLILFTLQLIYSPSQGSCTVIAGLSCSLTLSLQPNLISSFTWIGLLLAVLAVIILIAGVVFRLKLPSLGARKSIVEYRNVSIPPPKKRKSGKKQSGKLPHFE